MNQSGREDTYTFELGLKSQVAAAGAASARPGGSHHEGTHSGERQVATQREHEVRDKGSLIIVADDASAGRLDSIEGSTSFGPTQETQRLGDFAFSPKLEG
jgi:hypothetical protein